MSSPYPLDIPPLAAEAYRLAQQLRFGDDGGPNSSTPGVGALLATLAAAHPEGRLAELGSGVGAGAAWLASGMSPHATLVTCELEAERSETARRLLAADPRVTVLHGRWEDLLPERGPFDLIFIDCLDAPSIPVAWERVLSMVRVGGQVIFDDVTPVAEWPQKWRGHPDPKREAVLRDPRVVGVEVYPPGVDGNVGGWASGALIATRVH